METKVCTKCGKELPIDQFNWRNKTLGTRRSECKFCHSDYMKNIYKQKKDNLQSLKIDLKCKKCGYDKCGASLEFHHINPEEKDEKISSLMVHRYDLNNSDIQAELKKCIVLCSNCHHEFHYLYDNKIITSLEDFLNRE